MANLRKLEWISLSSNEIEQLEPDAFVTLPNLYNIDLQSNRLKTVHRNSFGSLASLKYLNLGRNGLFALDKTVIYDAPNLDVLFLHENLCGETAGTFTNFMINRNRYVPMLEECFSNYEQNG